MAKPDLASWQVDMAHFHDLLHQQGWDTYVSYVEKVITEETEKLLQMPPGLTPGTTDYYRGLVAGLRRALLIPQEVIRNVNNARNN